MQKDRDEAKTVLQNMCVPVQPVAIHSKREQISGDLLLSTEKLAEKCVYRDDNISRQTCVYYENIINLVTK